MKPVILHAPRWCSQPETISALTGATGAAKESFPLKEKGETQVLKAVTVCRNEHTGRISAGMMSGANRKALLSLDPKNASAEIITVGLKGATLVDNVVTGGTECIISRPLGAL